VSALQRLVEQLKLEAGVERIKVTAAPARGPGSEGQAGGGGWGGPAGPRRPRRPGEAAPRAWPAPRAPGAFPRPSPGGSPWGLRRGQRLGGDQEPRRRPGGLESAGAGGWGAEPGRPLSGQPWWWMDGWMDGTRARGRGGTRRFLRGDSTDGAAMLRGRWELSPV
jgi:hypothetical protein